MRLRVFPRVRKTFGVLNADLMASTESAQVIPPGAPLSGTRLLFFSQYQCAGSAGADVLAQDVSTRKVPGALFPAFGYCFPPPPAMAGHLLVVHHQSGMPSTHTQ